MSKKWIITIIIVICAASFIGTVQTEAASSGWSSQNSWGYDYYGQTDWNSSYNWNCGQYGSCQPSTNCYTSYCYPNQWVSSYNRAEFVQDVTFADGSYVAPGSYFTKTWRIRNTGVNAWNSSYRLIFVSGDQMSGPQFVSLPGYVASGQTIDISINLVAPQTSGTFRGSWMLQSPDGVTFGVGLNGQTPIWVNISTWQNNCYYPGNPNCTVIQPCYGSNCYPQGPAQRSGRNPYCNNKARSINDVTIPDGEIYEPGTYFRKTWRIKNGGTCVWDESYTIIFTGGDSMSGAEYIHMPKKVYPGETVEVSIDLRAPENPGTYRGYYKIQDNLGYTFGYGSYANTAFWAEIQVRNPADSTAAVQHSVTEPTAISTAEAQQVAETSEKSEAAAEITETPAETETAAETETPEAEVPEETPESPADEEEQEEDTVSESASIQASVASADEDNETEADLFIEEPLEEPLVNEPDEKQVPLPTAEPALNACGTQHIEVDHSVLDTYNISWYVENSGKSAWSSDTYRLVNAGISDNLYLISNTIVIPDTKTGEQAKVEFSARVWDVEDTESTPWLKFYISDGTASFCDVYFNLQN